jgi:hypothetical protein
VSLCLGRFHKPHEPKEILIYLNHIEPTNETIANMKNYQLYETIANMKNYHTLKIYVGYTLSYHSSR